MSFYMSSRLPETIRIHCTNHFQAQSFPASPMFTPSYSTFTDFVASF